MDPAAKISGASGQIDFDATRKIDEQRWQEQDRQSLSPGKAGAGLCPAFTFC
jgi:hypothetical protein